MVRKVWTTWSLPTVSSWSASPANPGFEADPPAGGTSRGFSAWKLRESSSFLLPHLISSSSSPPFEGANEAANLSKTPCKCWRLVSHFMRWLQLCLDSFAFKSNISAISNIGIKYIWSKVKKLLESSNPQIRQSLRRDKASVNILHLVCHALWWLPKKHRKVNSLDDDCSCRLDQSIAFDMICIIFDDSDTLFKGLTDAWSQACLHNRMSPSNRSFPILPGFYTNPFPSCLSQWFQQRWSSLFKYLLETQRTKTKGFKSWFDAERCQRVAQAGAHLGRRFWSNNSKLSLIWSHLLVNCPTRWSLSFIFVFLCWSTNEYQK